MQRPRPPFHLMYPVNKIECVYAAPGYLIIIIVLAGVFFKFSSIFFLSTNDAQKKNASIFAFFGPSHSLFVSLVIHYV